MISIGIALGLSSLYILLQGFYIYWWNHTPKHRIPKGSVYTTGVTVVVVAHNEEQSIGSCLKGLLNQQYPTALLEIIVIDDHSKDGTYNEIKQIKDPRIRYFLLKDFPAFIHPPAYKKSGITLAVDHASFDLIVVTDADCIHSPDWLSNVVNAFKASNAVFQTAPVLMTKGKSMLANMQQTEQLVLMLISGAGIHSRLHDMANGANMAFTKMAFNEVHGFEGNYSFASGDDMFLIEKMRARFPDQIQFLKSPEAAVYTNPKSDWASFLQQRLRWAGKNKGLLNPTINRIWMFIGIYHVMMVLLLLLACFNWASWSAFLLILISKWIMDFIIVENASRFFHANNQLKYFIPLQILYTCYVIRLGIDMLLHRKGDWERRT